MASRGRPGLPARGSPIPQPQFQRQPPTPPEPEPPAAPTLTDITPDVGAVGAPTTMTLTGTGFTAASVVRVDGNPVVTHYVSATELTADLPSFGAAGAHQVAVDEGGQLSSPQTFTVA